MRAGRTRAERLRPIFWQAAAPAADAVHGPPPALLPPRPLDPYCRRSWINFDKTLKVHVECRRRLLQESEEK